jgi:hypothetical protein
MAHVLAACAIVEILSAPKLESHDFGSAALCTDLRGCASGSLERLPFFDNLRCIIAHPYGHRACRHVCNDGLRQLLDKRLAVGNDVGVCRCLVDSGLPHRRGREATPVSGLFQKPAGLLVPELIPLQLLRPVIDVGFWNSRSFAVVRMPEAAIHEQRGAPSAEDKVGRSGQVGAMEPKAQLQRVRRPPDVHFWGGVLRLDLRHRPGAMTGVLLRQILSPWRSLDRQDLRFLTSIRSAHARLSSSPLAPLNHSTLPRKPDIPSTP